MWCVRTDGTIAAIEDKITTSKGVTLFGGQVYADRKVIWM